ncbi:UNVERIFIED_ORG: putative spermidine/putrescine transport system substrate-binding protein [Pseudomonas reinekei]|uniref:ABC transporter substrate-binding protein n=1 Tax=Pseudomonas laurylsulfatiphila TaxID=2011015 RepID=UPI003D24E7EC|nr:putative spermidine/putrescine transport system substrate-binding protein [Pseudomonas reinekei]MDF9906518.1 putative spermidine/putrescine transport system substrate-binding protein [Pseudomonas reinekei]
MFNAKPLITLSTVFGLLCVGALSSSVQARDLTVVSWGGSYQDVQRQIFFAPYAKDSGHKVLEDSWDSGIGILRTKADGPDSGWDVVQVEGEDLQLGCSEDLFLPLDFSRIGGKDNYIPSATSECGVGAAVYNFVLGYDKSKLKGTPQGWNDFFDLKTYPGKRALRQGPKGNLEIALMADGVPVADVYKVLTTPEGVKRAFTKLDQIKDQLLFWKSGGQPMQLLASGEVAMTTSYNGRVTNAINQDHKPFGLVWNQSLQTMDSWVILRNSPNVEAAYGLLKEMGNPEQQKLWPALQPTGITAVKGIAQVDPKVLADMPSAPQNSQNVLQIDDKFWVDRVDELSAKWTAWSAK